MTDSGTAFSPAKYAQRYGETAEGLVAWAELNQTHLGLPGEYNAAVLMQAAGTIQALQDDLAEIKACRSILRRVLDGESLLNEEVKAEFRAALDVIESSTASVVIVATATTATPHDA